jgi:adenylate cyclase
VKAVLMHARTGRVLWGQSFKRKLRPGGIIALRDEIANAIIRAVAEPFGVILNRRVDSWAGRATELATSTDSIFRFYQYRRSYRRDLFQPVRLSLERAVTACPEDSESMACLSLVHSDGHRFGFATAELPAALRQSAAALARRAIELNPDSARGHHALGVANWFLQDTSASTRALQAALALNPNSSETLGDLGLLLSLLGDWKQALPLLEEAKARAPAQGGASRVGLSLYHFVGNRFDQALADALEIDAPDVTHGFVARAISQIRLGRKGDAASSVERIIALAPHRPGGVLAELGEQSASPELVGKICSALGDAGLPPEFVSN